MNPLFHNRKRAAADEGFIYSTWMDALYFGNPMFREMNEYQFRKSYQKVIDFILKNADVHVCCLSEDNDVILGYAVTETKGDRKILHFVFVKQAWRKQGIARSLVPIDITSVTHLTKTGQGMKPKEWEFDPFLI